MKNLRVKGQNMMNCQGPPKKNVLLNVHLIMMEAVMGTREVEVQVLKQKEDAIKIENEPMMSSQNKKLKSVEEDKQMLQVKNDLETPVGNIRPVVNDMMFIAETMTEVVVRPLMWKEDIAKTEVTLVITLAAAELRSSRM